MVAGDKKALYRLASLLSNDSTLKHRKHYDFLREILCQELAVPAKLVRVNDLKLEANTLILLIDGISTGLVINPIQFSSDRQKYLVR